MDSELKLLKEPEDLSEGTDLINNSIEETVTEIAFNALITSQTFKQPRMDKIAKFERMYYNDIPPAFRQIHNVKMPIFSGLIDTMLADFNDEIMLKFKGSKPSDLLIMPKVQAHFVAERDSLEPTAMWNMKARWDRFNAMLSGRGIIQEYAESDPEYRNVIETINYSDFHCQPLGGGDLENHMFAGREGIFRTIEEIYQNEAYPKKQRQEIKDFGWNSEFWQQIETTYGTKLQRFRSLDQDVESNSYSGDRTINLCRFVVTFRGTRYAVLFEPLSKIWLSVEKWSELNGGLDDLPWKSWATHEDHKVFWSKSFADDFYEIADLVNIFYSQEATNREKRNNGARAYDPMMYKDVGRLDEAQYVPGRLVPYDSQNFTKKAADGIYDFTTPELNGTINLIENLSANLGKYTGANDLSLGGPGQKGTKPAIVMAQQQQLAKRIGFRSDSFKECYARLGKRFFEGMKNNMPAKLSISILGENGLTEDHELTREEMGGIRSVSVSVMSTSEQESADNLKRDSRVKAITMIAQNPDLNKFEKETILRDIGQFDESQIAFALEELPYTARKQIGYASLAIQSLWKGKDPEVYFGADITYYKYIHNYLIDNRTKLKGKYELYFAFLKKIGPIVEENMKSQAKEDKASNPQSKDLNAKGGDATGAKKSPIQQANPANRAAQAAGQAAAV